MEEDFRRSYDLTFADPPLLRTFVHGRAEVRGVFQGSVRREGDILVITGTTIIEFEDTFTDPLNIRQFSEGIARRMGITIEIEPSALTELGGTAYKIVQHWSVPFRAEVFVDTGRSRY